MSKRSRLKIHGEGLSGDMSILIHTLKEFDPARQYGGLIYVDGYPFKGLEGTDITDQIALVFAEQVRDAVPEVFAQFVVYAMRQIEEITLSPFANPLHAKKQTYMGWLYPGNGKERMAYGPHNFLEVWIRRDLQRRKAG